MNAIEDAEDYTELALLIGALIAAYFIWQKFSSGVSSLTAPLTDAAANAFVNLTSGGAAVAAGNVILPDGTSVPVSSITPVTTSSGAVQFTQSGQTYTINPGTDANGDWTAD